MPIVRSSNGCLEASCFRYAALAKLKQSLIALSVQFVEGIVEVILILKRTDVC